MSDTTTPDLTNPDVFQAELNKIETDNGATEANLEGEGQSSNDTTPAPVSDDTINPGNDTIAASDEDDDIIVTDKGKMVPYSAFKKKVASNQEANDRALQAETKLDLLVRTLEAKAQREAEPTKAAVTEPEMTNPYDINVQPVEYLAREVEIGKAENKALRDQFTNSQKQTQQQTTVQNMFASADADIANAVKSGAIPDADARSVYLLQTKAKEFGLFYPQQQAQEAVRNFSLSLIGAAKDRGVSIAQHVKDLSDIAGYQPKTTTPVTKTTQARDVDVLGKNKAKSSTLNSTTSAELNGSPNTIKAALNKNGRGTNEDAFNRMLAQLQ